VLAQVLSGGRSSRMYESLVRDKQIAVQVGAGTGSSRGPRLLWNSGTPGPGRTVDDL